MFSDRAFDFLMILRRHGMQSVFDSACQPDLRVFRCMTAAGPVSVLARTEEQAQARADMLANDTLQHKRSAR